MTKFKIQNKFKSQIPKQKFCYLSFVLWYYFVICALVFVIFSNVYAFNLDNLKVNFLKGDYKNAILEGEKIIASHGQSADLDELYYFLGLSYLKDENYLRASDIFEIILKEFKDSAFKEEAKLGLADAYFLRGDFKQAQIFYKELLSTGSRNKLMAQVYSRLSQIGFKEGNTQQAKEYLEKIKQEFPLGLELSLNEGIPASDFYYTVQVGSFSNSANARNLLEKLIQKGYSAYIEEASFGGKTTYRVRIAKTRSRQEIEDLERKLSLEGYPTKIYP